MWIILQEMLPILTQNHFRNTKTREADIIRPDFIRYPQMFLGGQTGATPDGRYAHTPVADGVSPSAGKDVKGPTAAATSVSRLDHFIVSNGTLFNQKFHPSALAGREGLEKFVALIRGYFDQKGIHAVQCCRQRDTSGCSETSGEIQTSGCTCCRIQCTVHYAFQISAG